MKFYSRIHILYNEQCRSLLMRPNIPWIKNIYTYILVAIYNRRETDDRWNSRPFSFSSGVERYASFFPIIMPSVANNREHRRTWCGLTVAKLRWFCHSWETSRYIDMCVCIGETYRDSRGWGWITFNGIIYLKIYLVILRASKCTLFRFA